MVTYSINEDLATAFQRRFPRRASQMVEDYIRAVLGDDLGEDAQTIQEIERSIYDIEKEEANLHAKKLAQIALRKEREAELEAAKQQKLEEQADEQLRFSGWKLETANRVSKFEKDYIFSDERQKGLSEFDFWKLYRGNYENEK